MNRQLYLGFLLSLTCAVAQAQTFKCKTPDGKSFFSDTGCPSQSAVQSVRQNEYISVERQRQAYEVNSRNANQLGSIEMQKASDRESIRRQILAIERDDAQQAAIAKQQEAENNLKRQRNECSDLNRRATTAAQSAAVSEICAKPQPDRDRFNDCKDKLARATSPSEQALIAATCTGDPNSAARVHEAAGSGLSHVSPAEAPHPLAIIKNCNGANCSDQMGNRYNTTAGKTVRSDGKRCYQRGNAMYCD